MRVIISLWFGMIVIGLGLAWIKLDDLERGQVKTFIAGIYPSLSEAVVAVIAAYGDDDRSEELSPTASPTPEQTAKQAINHTQHFVARPDACKPVPSRERVLREQVYRWQDGDGVTHFSDQKPASPAVTKLSRIAVEKLDYFNAKFNRNQSTMSADTFLRIQSGVTLIYRILTDVIGVEQSRHIALNMRFIDSKEAFHQHRLLVAPDTSPNATGFYSTATNESVIYSGMGDRITEKIALHEATHAIVAAMFGTTTPTWLNEGLASYLEELEIKGDQARRVGHDRRRLEIVRQASVPDLASLLYTSHTQWYSAASLENNYAFSWSVVRFMMSDKRSIGILGGMLNELAKGQCLEIDARAHINRRYPGGFIAFEADWQRWLHHGMEGVQSF